MNKTATFYQKLIASASNVFEVESILSDMVKDRKEFGIHDYNLVRANGRRKASMKFHFPAREI